MYCRHCGKEIDGEFRYCPECGAYNEDPIFIDKKEEPVEDKPSFWWLVLGLFIPIVGFILWILWYDKKPLTAKKAGIGAIIGIILQVIVGIIIYICAILNLIKITTSLYLLLF